MSQPLEIISFMVAVMVVTFAFPVWALIDLYHRSDADFERIDSSRGNWAVGVAVSLFLVPLIGILVALWYLIVVRRRLAGNGAGPVAGSGQ